MATLEKLEFTPFGPCRFIGKSVYARCGPQWSGPIFGALWANSAGIFAQLDPLPVWAPGKANHYALLTADKYDEPKQLLGYTVGRFMEAGTPVPDGLDHFDIPAVTAAIGWIRGKFWDMIGNAHRLTAEAIQRQNQYAIISGCLEPGAANAEVYAPETVPEDHVESAMGYMFLCQKKENEVSMDRQAPVDNPHGVRIVRLPPGRMVTSGPGFFGDENFARFERFLKRQPPDLSPRNFCCEDPASGKLAWNYVLPPGVDEPSLGADGLAVADFPGGLYAVRVARDNDPDTERVHGLVIEWIKAAGWRVDESRRGMGHMVAPYDTRDRLGYQQMDVFVPIA
jgi:hypothetical protein